MELNGLASGRKILLFSIHSRFWDRLNNKKGVLIGGISVLFRGMENILGEDNEPLKLKVSDFLRF